MENLFLAFFSEWYNLVPVEFIILCLCVYFFIKLVHKGIRFVMRSITKALGNELLEASGTVYCLMVIEAVLLFYMFVFNKSYISSCVEPRLSSIILFIVLVSVIIVTFIQSTAYLLFGWGYTTNFAWCNMCRMGCFGDYLVFTSIDVSVNGR